MFRGAAYASPPASVVRWRKTASGVALSVSLDEIKKWLNKPVEDTYFDTELTTIAKAAQSLIERHCQFQMTFGTWVGTLAEATDSIRLLRRPFVDVTGIEYVAEDGTITTMPTTQYHALEHSQSIGMLMLGDGLEWPAMARRLDAMRITVRSGYSLDASEITAGARELPEDIRRALLMTIASMDASHGDDAGGSSNTTVYAMKQASGAGTIPQSAKMLLAPYCYRSVGAV
jgi:hypothetical protein